MYDQICHRMCVGCKTQFPKVLQSGRMQRFPLRPEIGEKPETAQPKPVPLSKAEEILANEADTGNKEKLAAAATAILCKGGTSTAPPGGEGKANKGDEKAKKQETLRLEWLKWHKYVSEDTQK